MLTPNQLNLGSLPLTDGIVRDVSDTYTVPAYVRKVHAKTVSATGAFTITMCRPEECPFETKTVYMDSRNGTDDITVSGVGFSNITLDLAAEFTTLYSDGTKWVEVASNHA